MDAKGLAEVYDENPRISALNNCPVVGESEYVLYWMIAARRTRWNFGLERAAKWARELGKPLIALEALRCDYPWASDRLHAFILSGMHDNKAQLSKTSVFYYPYVERRKGEGKGLLEALAASACIVVTDYFPAFFLPQMIAAASRKLRVRLEAVDSNGIVPIDSTDRIFATAASFRRFLHKLIVDEFPAFPREEPLGGAPLAKLANPPPNIADKWPPAEDAMLRTPLPELLALPIDHSVHPTAFQGGAEAARERVRSFLRRDLNRYHTDRNHPDENAVSGLSPYLHFGHISTHEIFAELANHEEWSVEKLNPEATGKRVGWWGMSEGAEAFLDQLIVWRELGFNMHSKAAGCDRLDSLPSWAYRELSMHASDPRPYSYSLDDFESARTHDPVWNAAQRQLLAEGRIHNYLRMLWGKKILEWSASPEEALAIMLELNNKYALDGRDPNSTNGIFWVLGRYDRPWGPRRPIYGAIRYMSSAGALRKVKMKEYMRG